VTTNRPTAAAGTDSGLAGLVLIARLLGVAADPARIAHEAGLRAGETFSTDDILRAARRLGLKARALRSRWDRLAGMPLPALAERRGGGFLVLARVAEDRVLVQAPDERAPHTIGRDEFEKIWAGRLILVGRKAADTEGARRFGLRWFVPAIVRYRHLLGEVLLASFFLQLFALVTPLFFQVVVDKVLVHRGLTTLDVLAFGLLAVSLFEVVLGGLRTWLFAHTANRIDVELGARLFRHLLSLPLAYFEARRTGDSVARVRELENIRQFLTGSSLTLVIDSLFTVVFLAVMYYYSPALTAVVLASIPLYVILSAAITPVLRARVQERFARGAENQAFLVETVDGIGTLKSMAVEPQMQRRWEEQLAAYVKASFRAANLSNIAGQAAGFINKVVVVLILWVGARAVMEGRLSVGQLIAFNMLAARVSGPILRLVQLWQEFQQAGVSLERLGDILNTPGERACAATTALPVRGDVRFEQASFRYRPEGGDAVHRLDFHIRAGEVVGIVGRSGSGKSTIARLVQRLYVPQSGRVSIDGQDLALIDPAWLRRQVGVVPQEPRLFSGSVRDNIALSDPGLPMESVVRAARLAGAHEFILELPEGYDTPVGEHGAALSGGQRQRIAIARALVTDPRILVLDEATSALDYESEHILQRNMQAICHGRTVLIIAHRLSALRHADRILVLERGRLVEQGDHASLLRANGLYARLHALQSGQAARGVA